MDDDFEVDVAGVPMPAWMISRFPSQVIDIKFRDDHGEVQQVVCFEQLFGSIGYTCTWPRHASMITRPDPQHECGQRYPTCDETAMTAHAWTHIETL